MVCWVGCSVDDVEGIEQLRWDDQQRIRQYVESSGGGGGASQGQAAKADSVKIVECGIEVSSTSRAVCKRCAQKILKGEVWFYCAFCPLQL